mgnify:FL=1
MALNGVSSQTLLIPEIIELSEQDSAVLMDLSAELSRFGLSIENFGGNSIVVREIRFSAGAEFIVIICGNIMTMPGLSKIPSAESIDYINGKIVGL